MPYGPRFIGGCQICAAPPSTNSSVPVTKLLSSEARKTAARAISSGVPKRPSTTLAIRLALSCSPTLGLRQAIHDRRVDRSWTDSVHADLSFLQIKNPGASEREPGGFGRAVDG